MARTARARHAVRAPADRVDHQPHRLPRRTRAAASDLCVLHRLLAQCASRLARLPRARAWSQAFVARALSPLPYVRSDDPRSRPAALGSHRRLRADDPRIGPLCAGTRRPPRRAAAWLACRQLRAVSRRGYGPRRARGHRRHARGECGKDRDLDARVRTRSRAERHSTGPTGDDAADPRCAGARRDRRDARRPADRPLGNAADRVPRCDGAVPDRADAACDRARCPGRAVLRPVPGSALLRSALRAPRGGACRSRGAPGRAAARLRIPTRSAYAIRTLQLVQLLRVLGTHVKAALAAGIALAFLVTSGVARALSAPELMQMLADVSSSRVQFIETRHSALFKKPMVTSGRLVYRRPDRLEKHVQSPFVESTIIEGNRVSISRAGADADRMATLPASGPAQALIGGLRATLAGDLAALERHFVVDVAGTRGDWTMTLTPREPALAAAVVRVEFAGQGNRLRRGEVGEAGGDRTVTTISDE